MDTLVRFSQSRRGIEQLLYMLAEMERFIPCGDSFSQVIRQELASTDMGELDDSSLDLVAGGAGFPVPPFDPNRS